MEKLVFRPATEEDFLGTHSRREILGRLQEYEVDPRLILGDTGPAEYNKWVLTDGRNVLNQLQNHGALEHFSSKEFDDVREF